MSSIGNLLLRHGYFCFVATIFLLLIYNPNILVESIVDYHGIARASTYQNAARVIYGSLIHTPALKFLEVANDHNSVLSHNARVEFARVKLYSQTGEALNLPLRGELDLNRGNMSMHDVGKSFMHSNPLTSIHLLRPEEFGLAIVSPEGSQTDNRSPELQLAYLMHPDIGYCVINLLTRVKILPLSFADTVLPSVYDHHETYEGKSYPRSSSRHVHITSSILCRLADMLVGLGVESREYRHGVVDRTTQAKVFEAILSNNVLDSMAIELGLIEPYSKPDRLRELLIAQVFKVEDQMGVLHPEDRLSYFDIPKPRTVHKLVDHSKIGFMVWRNYGERLGERRMMLEKRLEEGGLRDDIREDVK